MDEIAELRARVAALEAQAARQAARAVGQLRADNAKHMSSAGWASVYGSGGRPAAAVAAERQLTAKGRVWGSVAEGPEMFHGQEERAWR